MSKVWSLWSFMAHGKKNQWSQNFYTADLGYLGFQDYLKKLQLCSVKIKGGHTPCDITRSRFRFGKNCFYIDAPIAEGNEMG